MRRPILINRLERYGPESPGRSYEEPQTDEKQTRKIPLSISNSLKSGQTKTMAPRFRARAPLATSHRAKAYEPEPRAEACEPSRRERWGANAGARMLGRESRWRKWPPHRWQPPWNGSPDTPPCPRPTDQRLRLFDPQHLPQIHE
jgi:hypothetical protein